MGDVNITTSFKDVRLKDIDGKVNVLNNFGSISAYNIDCRSSICRFETTHGQLRLENINGEVEAITSGKPLILKSIDAGKGLIHAVNNYGIIEATDLTGVLGLKTEFSAIEGKDLRFSAGKSKISTSYNAVILKGISVNNSEVDISNSFSDVLVAFEKDVSTRLVLTSDEGGSISTEDLFIKPTTISRNRFEGFVGDGQSNLAVNVQGIGKIEIRGEETKSKSSF
jgi:hypothetical protein